MHVSTPMKRQSLPGDTTSALSWDTELSPGRSAPLDIYLLYPAGEFRGSTSIPRFTPVLVFLPPWAAGLERLIPF